MARIDDYRTNAEGTNSKYDIIVDIQGLNLGLNLYGPNPISGQFGPGEYNVEQNTREQPIIFDDFSNGMGMSYRGVSNTYAFAENMYTRKPRAIMPGGLLTEIDLTGLGFDLSGELRAGGEWNSDVYIGAGSHIIKCALGATSPTDVYNVGNGSQIDSYLLYNNIPLFSTDQTYTNWQYLTGYDVSGTPGWKTANSDGSHAGFSIRTGADRYQYYQQPIYLEKMAKTFEEIDGIGGTRIFGNNSHFTYINTQSNNIDVIIGDFTGWSSSLQCGDTSAIIQQIVATNRVFYIVKTDGVYLILTSGVYCPNVTPGWRENVSFFNGMSASFFAGYVMAGNVQGMERVDVASQQRIDVPIQVNPSGFYVNETPVYGIPVAQCVDGGWLAVALWNGVNSYICYTRPRETTLATIPNPMVWHGSECTIKDQRVTMMFKSSVTGSPVMWIGTHDGTQMHLYNLSLPVEDPFSDYLHGGDHKFSPTSKLYLPFDDWKDGTAKKVIRRYDIQTDNLTEPVIEEDGTISDVLSLGEVEFYANADSGSRVFFEDISPTAANSEWQFQGAASVSPKTTMIASGRATEGTQIGILLVGNLIDQGPILGLSESLYKPFVIRSVKIRAEVLVEQMEEREYTVIIGKMNTNNRGGRDYSELRDRFNQIVGLQNAGPVYVIDEFKEKSLAKIEPGFKYKLIKERVDQPYMLILTFSISYLGKPFFWDLGDNYDNIYVWG